MRRRGSELLPLEVAICVAAGTIRREGHEDFHGYQLAKRLADGADRRSLTAYGTLYRALARLEQMGHLTSRQEDPAIAAQEHRPGRRLYALTDAGLAAARQAQRAAAAPQFGRIRRRPVHA